MYASVLHLWPVHYCATKGQSSVLPHDWWWSALSRFLTNRWTNRASWQNSWLELIITADSQQSLAKPPFINSFIHLRKDVLTDGSTTLCCLCCTADYLWLSNLSLSLASTVAWFKHFKHSERSSAPDASQWNTECNQGSVMLTRL